MTRPVAMMSAIERDVSMLYPERYMTPNVPRMETGTTIAGIKAARTLAGTRRR